MYLAIKETTFPWDSEEGEKIVQSDFKPMTWTRRKEEISVRRFSYANEPPMHLNSIGISVDIIKWHHHVVLYHV